LTLGQKVNECNRLISTIGPSLQVWETTAMAKKKLIPRGPWQATGMQKLRIPKDDPRKLRMRAQELKLKAERLSQEADGLLVKAEEIESALS
jgi:hypothetical protein